MLIAPWHIEGCAQRGFSGAVVIPALAEHTTIFATLDSLAANPPELLSSFLILIVVNHREDASLSDKADNLTTLAQLRGKDSRYDGMRLAWIDAASPGLELPVKKGGVGLARRIGLDLTLERLDYTRRDPLLVCLDADTLVRPDYLSAIVQHFEHAASGGAILHFLHQPAQQPEEQAAIDRYELFLRCYVLGLKLAGSPYGFHTVGSAMACRASAYLKAGGMNSRAAGEDFYFLQQLARTAGVEQVNGTVVYPSPRASHRVPFGTGRSVSKMLESGEGELLFYDSNCCRQLGEWLTLVNENLIADGDLLLKKSTSISIHLHHYLSGLDFAAVWDRLKQNNRPGQAQLKAFHDWFDGLRTMKLIHHLSSECFPRCGSEQAVPGLLQWAGLEMVNGVEQQLDVLRRLQLG